MASLWVFFESGVELKTSTTTVLTIMLDETRDGVDVLDQKKVQVETCDDDKKLLDQCIAEALTCFEEPIPIYMGKNLGLFTPPIAIFVVANRPTAFEHTLYAEHIQQKLSYREGMGFYRENAMKEHSVGIHATETVLEEAKKAMRGVHKNGNNTKDINQTALSLLILCATGNWFTGRFDMFIGCPNEGGCKH